MPSYFRLQLEDWLKQISVGPGRILDVGGAQKPVAPRLAKCEAHEILTLDLETPHEGPKPDIAADLNIWDETKVLGLAEVDADVVFCLEVMEYIWNPLAALSNIMLTMKPGATLYISFPFVYPIHKPYGADFLRYTEDGARKLLEVSGFEIQEVRPRVARSVHLLKAFYSNDGMKHRSDDSVGDTGYMIIAKRPKI